MMCGPEHHAMIAAVLVTAYTNLTGKVTDEEIKEAIRRGAIVPGGYCGLYGTDAAAIATGIAMSTILKATPLTDYETAIESANQYFKEVLSVELEHIPVSKLKCEHSSRNKNCAKADCRFYAVKVGSL